jgi:hypothetical protein
MPKPRWLRVMAVALAVAVVPALSSCVVRTEVRPGPGSQGGGLVPEDLPPGVRYAGPGAEATTYLRRDTDRIVVEVDQAEGAEISPEALAHFRTVLGSVTDKPVEVETSTIFTNRSTHTAEDLRAFEQENRQTATDGDTASMYVLSLNGSFSDQQGIIGVAYSGSSFALFLEQNRGRGLGDSTAVERAVLVHEAGHLLALVNVGYESPRGRGDPDYPNHSLNEDSVMNRAVESIGIFSVFGGGPPDDFDADDRADLADIASGSITPEF